MSNLRYVRGSLSFAILCAVLTVSAATTPPVRIMPLGDSITYGASVPGGYRAPLYASLTGLGYNVDYVGTQTGNGIASLPDSDHEGHSGYRISQIDAALDSYLNAVADPDVILLHIGTNDANDGDFANAINRLDALVTKIATSRPYAHIIVTSLLPRTEPEINTSITNLFNPYVPGIVAAQAALGRRVTFLDMHAYLTTADLADIAHPNQTGYNKMAAAWLPAITNVIAPSGDSEPPALVSALSISNNRQVEVTFSKPVTPGTATNITNYVLNNGLTITGASIDAEQRTVTLSTSPQTTSTQYTLTVNNITDGTFPTPLSIPADSQIIFLAATPRGYSNNVADSAGYTLVYSLDIPASVNYTAVPVVYAVDNHLGIGSFSRVAYYMELQKPGEDLTYVWASVDAFTNNTASLGVPTYLSGAVFQKPVSNLTVESNVPGVTTGTGFSGNLEFWPYSYVYANSAGVPGASSSTCDFGDGMNTGASYGSMQLHNTGEKQTLFAFNHWNLGTTEVGIGNQPTGQPDWTFANNGGTYTVKTLQVLVFSGSDTNSPTLVSALMDAGRTNITVRFSEPLAPSSVNGACFSLDKGVQVVSATLSVNQLDVLLLTTRLPEGTAILSVTGVRDSAAANPIVPGSSISVDCGSLTYPLPSEVAANVPAAAGYQLVCSIANIPVYGNFNTSSADYSADIRASVGPFSRVAYYLELKKAGEAATFIWTSMDAFTTDAMKLGIPVIGTAFQQKVTRLDVLSDVTGVVNGTGISTGNIEFWPSNFGMGNSLPISGASNTAFDFGDGDGNSTSSGHGCLQVHNYGASQTLLAINHFNSGNAIGLGIGNNPNPHPTYPDPDYTATYNAASYESRVLHVFVLPGTVTGIDTAAPTLTGIMPSPTLKRILVTFSESLADSAASADHFSFNGGVTVTSATLQPDKKVLC